MQPCQCGCGKLVRWRFAQNHDKRQTGTPPNPSGQCQCGCGRQTKRAKQTDNRKGNVRGEYVRCVRGHEAHRPLGERFWEKVKKGADCWEWQAASDARGYGRISIGSGIVRSAHRVSYELNTGPIPEGMQVCHQCDNPRCVNPAHLFLGTQRDNMHDMFKKQRQGTTKLSPAQVAEVRSLCTEGWGREDIAAAYGVHRSTVQHIHAGKTHRLLAA